MKIETYVFLGIAIFSGTNIFLVSFFNLIGGVCYRRVDTSLILNTALFVYSISSTALAIVDTLLIKKRSSFEHLDFI